MFKYLNRELKSELLVNWLVSRDNTFYAKQCSISNCENYTNLVFRSAREIPQRGNSDGISHLFFWRHTRAKSVAVTLSGWRSMAVCSDWRSKPNIRNASSRRSLENVWGRQSHIPRERKPYIECPRIYKSDFNQSTFFFNKKLNLVTLIIFN